MSSKNLSFSLVESNIEERRQVTQYYANELQATTTPSEIALRHQFNEDPAVFRVASGYIINDGPDSVNIELKFTTDETNEPYSDEISILPNAKESLNKYSLISSIRYRSTGTSNIRIFAT